MKTKLSNRIISLTLIFTLLLTICGIIPVWAIDSTSETSENRGHLSMAYLGTGATPETTAQTIPDTTAWSVGQKFWVGIYISDMKTMDTANASTLASGVSSLFEYGDGVVTTGGVYSFSSGIIYDADYIDPVAEDIGGTDEENMQEQLTASLLSMPLWETYSSRYSADAITAFKTDPLDHESAETTGIAGANKKTLAWSVSSTNALNRVWRNASSLTNDPLYLLVVQFELKAKPTPGTKVVSAARNANQFVFQTGTDGERWGAQWNKTRDITPEENLKNFLDYTGDLDLFPASASDYLDSIVVTPGPTKQLGGYIEGNTFEPAGMKVTPNKTESGNLTPIEPTNTDFKDLKFYVDEAGKTAETLAASTTKKELTTTTKLATTDNNKHVYVSYTLDGKTAIADIGAITVAAKSVSSITNQSTGDNATTFGTASAYYTGTALKDILTGTSAEKLTVVKAYDNGDKDEVVYSAFGTNGLAFYYVDANGKLQLVGDQTALAEGENKFYVAETGKANSEPSALSAGKYATYTITAVTDTMILKTATPAAKDLIYTEDTTGTHTINFADVVIGYNMTSAPDATLTTKKVSEIGSSKLIFYIGTTNVPNDNKYTTGATINGTEYDADTMADKYVFVVPAGLTDYTSVTPVLVGQLKDRAISTSTGDVGTGYTVTGITTDANTQYGAKLGDGAKITVTYDNGDTKELSYNDFATEGITMKIVDKDGNVLVGDTTAVTSDTVLTPAMNGGYVQFFYNGTKIGTSAALTVNKKTVGYSSNANLTTPEVKKEYDGTTKLADSDVAEVAFKIDESDLVAADNLSGKLDIDGVTYSYNSKNVANANAIVASEITAGSLAIKASTSGSADDVTKFNANYTLEPLTANTTVYTHDNVKITAKTLNVTSITGVPSVEVGATTGLTGTSTLALKNESATDTNSNIVKGDVVTLTYKYEYNAADVNAVGTPDVAITATGTEGTTPLGLSGTDVGNYTLGTLPTTKGTVVNKKLNTITINTAPTKATYTYPDTKLDLTGIKFDLNYEGATTPTTIDLAQFIADGGIITLTDAAGQSQTITADNAVGVISLPYGETTLNIAYGGKTTTIKVTTNKKPIKISEITFTASKVFGQDNAAATKTATPATGAIEAGDADAVQFTFDAAFADESAGENKNVTISNVKLVKKGEGTTDPSVNYVIVDDNGTEITAETTTTITTGVISQGSQTAPAAPTISVDPATNNIIVEGPLGENIEYSIDGGRTWQSEVTFTGLTKGKEYTVQARVKESEDGNYAPSDAASSNPIKTFAKYVEIYKVNAKEGTAPTNAIYTDITSVTSDSDINTKVFDKKPSSFKAYYTDLAGKTKVEYPYTLAAENVFYYTTSSGSSGGSSGGGSSVTTYTVKFNAGTNGKITNGKSSVSVTSGSKVSASAVPTVTANTGYEFIGWSQDGKTAVDPTTVSVTKAITFTALYEESDVKATPTPTVKPTDKPSEPDEPIIDVNYTKPYASGYEDDTFRPENKITRAELAAMIARLSYGDDLPDGAYVSSFPDVDGDAWFNKYVGYLEDKDVLNGYEDGTFRPYDTITRGEISTVIARAQRYELITYSGIFADVTDSDWAKDYIQTLAAQGIISGYEDGTFGPYSPLSRAEAVTIINNVLAPSTAIVTFTPSDIAGHWAEANIILAVNERMLGGTVVEVPLPEDTVPEATEVPVEEVPEGELDPTVKDEPVVPVNPEAGVVTDEEQKFIVK